MNGSTSTVLSGPVQSSKTTYLLRANIERSIEVHNRLMNACRTASTAAANAPVAPCRAGHKARIFGNGGSAGATHHLAAEFLGRYLRQRRPQRALALNAISSAVTAIGNDYGYDEVVARQLEAPAAPGDVPVAIGASKNSSNVISRRGMRPLHEFVHERAHRGLSRPAARACGFTDRRAVRKDAANSGVSHLGRSRTLGRRRRGLFGPGAVSCTPEPVKASLATMLRVASLE
jgi:phosphoheptose isomerase